MMRTNTKYFATALTSIALVITATTAHAQSATDEAPSGNAEATAAATPPPPIDDWDAQVSDFDKLRTPDSPAFVVLGVSPTTIQRPTTPRALMAALGGALSDGNFGVPKDFALEVAPYWLFGHPNVPVLDYRQNNWMRPLRTLSFSIATDQTARSEIDTTGMTITRTDSDIGLGVRTMLFQTGGDEDACTAKARQVAEGAQPLTATEMKEVEKVGQPGTKAFEAAYQTRLEKRANIHTDKCVALAASSTGLQVDLAGAVDLRAADSKLKLGAMSLAGYAVWANASYDTAHLSAVTMARLASHDVAVATERALDAGARVLYKAKNYVISAEALIRYRLIDVLDRTTTKVDVGFEYELTPDTWVSLSLGKDFAFAPGQVASLFSLANLKWSFVASPTGH
jgi:hypothetical protein